MDLTNISFLVGLVGGACIGFISCYVFRKYRTSYVSSLKTVTTNSPDADYRIVLVVRSDLNMGKGKIAAQCSHASVGAVAHAQRKDPEGLEMYKRSGQTKEALKIDSVEKIKQLANIAKRMGLITSIIRDAGRTQIAPNSITVLAIGPAPKDIIDKLTGHLKPL